MPHCNGLDFCTRGVVINVLKMQIWIWHYSFLPHFCRLASNSRFMANVLFDDYFRTNFASIAWNILISKELFIDSIWIVLKPFIFSICYLFSQLKKVFPFKQASSSVPIVDSSQLNISIKNLHSTIEVYIIFLLDVLHFYELSLIFLASYVLFMR